MSIVFDKNGKQKYIGDLYDQGEKDGWLYKRYNDGLMILDGHFNFKTNIDYKWGQIYTGMIKFTNNAKYPFPFIDRPIVHISLDDTTSYNYWICTANDNVASSLTQPVGIQACRAVLMQNVTGIVSFHVVGKWK